MKLTKEQSEQYHSHTIRNLKEIRQSKICGCMDCCEMYSSDRIEEFINDGGDEYTALCANCGTDAVIGDASGLEINDEILKALNKVWF